MEGATSLSLQRVTWWPGEGCADGRTLEIQSGSCCTIVLFHFSDLDDSSLPSITSAIPLNFRGETFFKKKKKLSWKDFFLSICFRGLAFFFILSFFFVFSEEIQGGGRARRNKTGVCHVIERILSWQ